MLLHRDRSLLMLIDMQDRLMPAIQDAERVVATSLKLVSAARRLDVPVLCSEQYPKGLGTTVPSVADALNKDEILPKLHFSCADDGAIAAAIAATRRRQIVLCGVEAHVCVLQTAMGLKRDGYAPVVVQDAVSSRVSTSVDAAVARLRQADIAVATFEMVAFEWLGQAGTPEFKDLRGLF